MDIRLAKRHTATDSELKLTLSRQADPAWDAVERVRWEVRNAGAGPYHGVFSLEVALPDSFRLPWIMVPGFFYGENRRIGAGAREDSYPRFDPAASAPHRMTSDRWDFAADRTSHPLVYAFQDGQCFAFAPGPHVEMDDVCRSDDWEPQVGIGFACDGSGTQARLTVPACEEPFTYADSTQSAPTIRRVRIPPGGAVCGELWLFRFAGARHDYQRVLEHYYRAVGGAHPAAEEQDPLGLMRDAVHGLVDWHYHEARNYFVYSRCFDRVSEQIANHKKVTLEWHQMLTGFVGGFPICWGLHAAGRRLGDARALSVARRVADRICTEGISPCGLFWADFRPGVIEERNGTFPNALAPEGRDLWSSGWQKDPQWLHTRTIADAAYSLAQLILSEREYDRAAASLPLWESALKSNVQAILSMQLPGGSYGEVYHAVERRVVKPDGCGGLLWIPALLKAAEVLAADHALCRRIRDSVRRAADAYAPAVEEEYIWGAPEDNDSPTSEDGLNAVMAYGDLYRTFHEPRHLELLRLAADWMLSFRKSYNTRFEPRTLIGAYGMRSKGGDYASVSNNHLHVFEVMVTPHLFDLARWTGNDYYRQRALDHWRFAAQMLCRVDGQFNGFRGAMGEQFYWCNWSSFGQDTTALEPDGFKGNWDPGPQHRQKGNMAGYSTLWCVNIILLGAEFVLREGEANR